MDQVFDALETLHRGVDLNVAAELALQIGAALPRHDDRRGEFASTSGEMDRRPTKLTPAGWHSRRPHGSWATAKAALERPLEQDRRPISGRLAGTSEDRLERQVRMHFAPLPARSLSGGGPPARVSEVDRRSVDPLCLVEASGPRQTRGSLGLNANSQLKRSRVRSWTDSSPTGVRPRVSPSARPLTGITSMS